MCFVLGTLIASLNMHMSRHSIVGTLDPLESRVAMCRAAGMSYEAISFDVGVVSDTIKNICLRDHVARKIIMLEAMIGRVTMGSLQDLDAAIQEKARTAFEVESKAMDDLVDIGDRHNGTDDHLAVKAIVAASLTAQDILDRAGKRAPTTVVTRKLTGQVPESAIAQIGNVLEEMKVSVTQTETK